VQMKIDDPKDLRYIEGLIGEEIGRGRTRRVFTVKDDLQFVIKQDISEEGANAAEYANYKMACFLGFREWLAPVVFLSQNGKYLVQFKCEKIRKEDIEKMPKKVPSFFKDLKRHNWGFFGGQFVCFDYAQARFDRFRDTNVKLKKVVWK
jgi:hypothetical protein